MLKQRSLGWNVTTTWHESLLSGSRLAFFSESNPAPRALPGTCEEKSAGQWISASGDEWAYAGCTPMYLTLSPQRAFSRSLHLPGPASLCGCERSGFIRWERWRWVGRQPVIGGFRCRGAAQPCASIPGMYADLFRILSNAVEELGLEWFPSVEQSRSRLDEWFLPGRHQAPRQRASPFFPNVHDEINKSCREPYSSHLRVSSSSALTSVDGAEEKGYDSLPPLD